MRMTIERAALLKTLGHVQRVVERRTTIPVLSNVLVDAADGKLSLTATDLDLEVREVVPAKVDRAGRTTIQAHVLHDIVRKLPDGDVRLDVDEGSGKAVVRAGRSRFELPCLPEGDFPELAVGDMPHRFAMPADALRSLLDRAAFAMSTEETRYYLNGVYVHAVPDGNRSTLRVVATDGHRLARLEAEAPEGASGFDGVIVPRKAVGEIVRLLGEIGGEAKVQLSSTKLRLEAGDVVLTTKLIDGTFPDYQRVIPASNPLELRVDRVALMGAVDRVTTISGERGRAVKLDLQPGRLALSVNNPDAGEALEELDVDYAGEPITVGFNGRYLTEVLGQQGCATTVIRIADPSSPARVESDGRTDELFVLMPLRV